MSQVACGTYIPSQRDWPNTEPLDVEIMYATLLRSIVCELSYAVTLAVDNDLQLARNRSTRQAYSNYYAGWGVEVATDLTVSESSTVSPSAIWAPVSPASALFTLGGGISAGSVASNENKFNVFYRLSDLYKPDVFRVNTTARYCRNNAGKQGSPLVDLDLKILPLLESRVQLIALDLAASPDDQRNQVAGGKNVLTQTVSIKETVSGDITPTWKFTTGSLNQSGTFFGANRERTHQVVFTFGKLDRGGGALTPLAQAFHVNEQLRVGLRASRIVQ